MNSLPREVLRNICSCLDRDDVRKFRLVCEAFSAVGADFIRPTRLLMFMSNYDFEKLVGLSASKHLVRGLVSLGYAPITLRSPGEAEAEYTTSFFQSDYWVIPAGGYSRYKALIDEQDRILKEDKDFQWFLSVLPLFPRLRDFTLYCGNYRTLMRGGLYRYQLDPQHFRCPDKFIDIYAPSHRVGVVLRALSGANLETLEIDHVDWRFFHQGDAQLHTLFQPIANLRNLTLIIDDEFESENQDLNCCGDLLRTGALRKCLSTLTALRSLTIKIDSAANTFDRGLWHYDSSLNAPLPQIFPSGPAWTSLTSLTLSNIVCSRQDMMEVLLQHKETLRELHLEDIYLWRTSWIPLLDSIRQELYLTRPRVSGFIAGRFEGGAKDGEWQFWRLLPIFILPPFNGRSEENSEWYGWRLVQDLGGLVNKYILEGGRAHPEMLTCPLTTENSGR
ncbi:hypothetical protein GGR53DRAFT_410399 [Hypoxylon sp. FL1150]|nr:hypothetical protein GGR53DRAFT_410399 [Hypoxylon sp. FL1150]